MKITRILTAAAAMAASTSLAGTAAARCWQSHEVEAAQVRHMQSKMMVAALTCRSTHPNVLANYNSFVKGQKALITEHNGNLRGYFMRTVGGRSGERSYDRFTTKLANHHATGMDDCAAAAAFVKEVAGASAAELVDLAYRVVDRAPIDGGRCGGSDVRIASARR